jgi:hypothetical protein
LANFFIILIIKGAKNESFLFWAKISIKRIMSASFISLNNIRDIKYKSEKSAPPRIRINNF